MKYFKLLFLLFLSQLAFSQSKIEGNFIAYKNQKIILQGFNGFDAYKIDSTYADITGKFEISYSKEDVGMGFLESEDGKSFVVVLSGNNMALKGNDFVDVEAIEILKGEENKLFDQYASEHPRREQTMSAWVYLRKIYKQDPLFVSKATPANAIETEIERIKIEDQKFLDGLNSKSYISYYLPIRKLVSSVGTVAQYRTEEIPATIAAFRDLDYTDSRLYKSGLLQDVIDAHFWLIENSGRSLNSVYIEMNKSIDILIENLIEDEAKLNEVGNHLFKLLEKRSLFKSSEYLALKLLNKSSCVLESNFENQLESYRAMKIGNTAPDFVFMGDVSAPGYNQMKPHKLSDIEADYTLLVFGASWCPHCPQELAQIKQLYSKWKSQSVEVVFVSLDTDQQIFKSFSTVFPFISICDYKKWESDVVKNYHVFATPTYFLLDYKRNIVLKPSTAEQMDAWVDWYLVKGNNKKD
ncbi:MAG: hypothetical protein C0599_00930 [Salinivirgaceae bacterium]|nr:MAG: hypothetical protein C0599_00930 [Salinivirgaceae bacterium]